MGDEVSFFDIDSILDDTLLLLFDDEDSSHPDFEFLATNLNLFEETLKAELDAEAIDKIMCELENSALFCVPTQTAEAHHKSKDGSRGDEKPLPLTDRLRHLIAAPTQKIRCVNASNLKGIQRIIEDICEEDCTVKILTLQEPLIGRHHYLELYLSMLRMFPDFLLQHKKTIYNHKLNVISVFTESTGTMQFTDRSEYIHNLVRFGDKATTAVPEALVNAYESIERAGGRVVVTARAVQHYVLNEDRTKVCKIVHIPKPISMVAASTESMLPSNESVYASSSYSSAMTTVSSSSVSSGGGRTLTQTSSSTSSTSVASHSTTALFNEDSCAVMTDTLANTTATTTVDTVSNRHVSVQLNSHSGSLNDNHLDSNCEKQLEDGKRRKHL